MANYWAPTVCRHSARCFYTNDHVENEQSTDLKPEKNTEPFVKHSPHVDTIGSSGSYNM